MFVFVVVVEIGGWFGILFLSVVIILKSYV